MLGATHLRRTGTFDAALNRVADEFNRTVPDSKSRSSTRGLGMRACPAVVKQKWLPQASPCAGLLKSLAKIASG
jgi:hypothetical protein